VTDIPSMHKEHAPKSAVVFIVTCSTSKAEQKEMGLAVEDPSGDEIQRLMREAGHRIAGRALIPDRIGLLRATVRKALKSDADAIIITGGTGIAPSDVTIEDARIRRTVSKNQLRKDRLSCHDDSSHGGCGRWKSGILSTGVSRRRRNRCQQTDNPRIGARAFDRETGKSLAGLSFPPRLRRPRLSGLSFHLLSSRGLLS